MSAAQQQQFYQTSGCVHIAACLFCLQRAVVTVVTVARAQWTSIKFLKDSSKLVARRKNLWLEAARSCSLNVSQKVLQNVQQVMQARNDIKLQHIPLHSVMFFVSHSLPSVCVLFHFWLMFVSFDSTVSSVSSVSSMALTLLIASRMSRWNELIPYIITSLHELISYWRYIYIYIRYYI